MKRIYFLAIALVPTVAAPLDAQTSGATGSWIGFRDKPAAESADHAAVAFESGGAPGEQAGAVQYEAQQTAGILSAPCDNAAPCDQACGASCDLCDSGCGDCCNPVRFCLDNSCCCAPNICRFDGPGDCSCCTTSEYCLHPCAGNSGGCHQTGNCGEWQCDGCYCDVNACDCGPIYDPTEYLDGPIVRFGYWGVSTDGDLEKVGEFQELTSSPFWDVDGMRSDGVRTLDFTLTGMDNEATDARAYYFGPRLTAKVKFNRFLRRLDHDLLAGADLNGAVPPGPADAVVTEDLNTGQDYAIRVEQLNARFQGKLTDNIKWRLNTWGMRKFGERQANAVGHCYNVGGGGPTDNTCHLQSQRQKIDWLTMEVQPVIEASYDNLTVEYSRTMRSFEQADGAATRVYSHFSYSPANDVDGDLYRYAYVPESFTQVDRLKVSAQLNDCNQLYANMYLGDTKNEFRNTRREFAGYDVRLINTSFERMKLIGFVKMDDENYDLPTDYLTTAPWGTVTGNPAQSEPGAVVRQVDYNRVRAGVKSQWSPCGSPRDRFSLVSGYEYSSINRDYAEYDAPLNGTFVQPDTVAHQIEFSPKYRFSQTFNGFVRYRGRFVDMPIRSIHDGTGTFNSNQPEQVHLVELGGTWTPASNLMATVQIGIQDSWHDSEGINFDEESYPLMGTLWYAPTNRLSFTGAYAYFSNWIDQDIEISFRNNPAVTEQTRWSYGGENYLLSLGANYAWTPCLQLVGGVEWNRGVNAFSVPASPAGADWSALPGLADVRVNTTRFHAGVDYQVMRSMDTYFRYVYFDYEDKSTSINSGTAHMFLGGLSYAF
ncbi:MAG: hypothetical protein KDA42_00045 [Planctomycetales bacterium]|nr:hypothetical protein [Planctomycetales bacterium]